MGWPHRAAVATPWRAWKRKEFVPRGMRAAQGKLFSLEGCGLKPKAQPLPRQDSRQAKDARAARSRMETWPTRHPRVTASPACALTRARPTPQRQARTLLAADCNDVVEAWRGCSIAKPGGRVGKPSFVTHRREPQALRTARFGTTCRSKMQRAPTSDHSGGTVSTGFNSIEPCTTLV